MAQDKKKPGWLKPLAFGALLAVLGHLLTIGLIPSVIMNIAIKRIAEASGGINRLAHGNMVTPQNQQIVRSSPDLAYSTCALDLSKGPVRVFIGKGADYTSAAFYAGNTDNVFTLNDRKIGPEGAQIMVVSARSPIAAKPGEVVVSLPSDKGLLLVRRLAPSAEAFKRVQGERAKDFLSHRYRWDVMAELLQTPIEVFETQGRTARVYHHGREPIKVVVLDDYLADPEAIMDLAVAGPAFAPNGPFYPGIRAPVPPSSFQTLLGPLAEILPRCFEYSGRAGLRECNFSLVTTPSDQLQPIQRLPHFDSLEYGRVAALLYLCRGENQGGTAFYRQRSTGFESVDAGRFPAFEAALKADVARHGLPDAAYINETSPLYEMIGRHQARFNRMIVYLSSSLHCAHIPNDFVFDPNPATGRLTVNAFLGMD